MARLSALAVLLLVASPAAAQAPRWLTHYQRGQSQMEDRAFQEAALSFLKAIREKGTDSERERLSGTRTTAYYPRRELGICLVELGILDFAAEELRASIAQSRSDRAVEALRRTGR